MENNEILREERARAQQLSRGIQGFGSFSNRTSAINGSFNDLASKKYEKRNSCHAFNESEEHDFSNLEKKLSDEDNNIDKEKQQVHNMGKKHLQREKKTNLEDFKIDHPFVEKENFSQASLLSV